MQKLATAGLCIERAGIAGVEVPSRERWKFCLPCEQRAFIQVPSLDAVRHCDTWALFPSHLASTVRRFSPDCPAYREGCYHRIACLIRTSQQEVALSAGFACRGMTLDSVLR